MVQLHDQINGVDSQLNQRFDEVLANQQEPPSKDKLHEVDNISILSCRSSKKRFDYLVM